MRNEYKIGDIYIFDIKYHKNTVIEITKILRGDIFYKVLKASISHESNWFQIGSLKDSWLKKIKKQELAKILYGGYKHE